MAWTSVPDTFATRVPRPVLAVSFHTTDARPLELVTTRAVKAHRGRLMKKTGARSLPELMTMAARFRIDGDPDT